MTIKNSKFKIKNYGLFLTFILHFTFYIFNCLYAMFDTTQSFSARAMALGGAYTAVSNDVSAINTNPAGLSQIENIQMLCAYSPIYDTDVYSGFFGVAVPYGYNTFGVGFSKTAIPSNYSENSCSIGYSRILGKNIFFGFALKVLYLSAPGYSKYNDPAYSGSKTDFSYDVGFFENVNSWFSVGLKAENLNEPKVKLLSSSEGETIPAKLKLGCSFKPKNMVFAVDIADMKKPAENINLGSEISFSDFFAIRLGLTEGTITSGVGFKIKNFQTDFGFFFHKELGVLYKTGITFNL